MARVAGLRLRYFQQKLDIGTNRFETRKPITHG